MENLAQIETWILDAGSLPYLFGVLEALLLTYLQQALLLDLIGERFEAKFGTSGGQRLNNPEEQMHTRRAVNFSLTHTQFLPTADYDMSADLLM